MKGKFAFGTPCHVPTEAGNMFDCASSSFAAPKLRVQPNQPRAESRRTVRFALLTFLLGVLGWLCLAGVARASTNLLTSANIMVLQYYPTWIDTNDNINVRGTVGDTRYGVFEFDLSGVTPFILAGASLELTCVWRAVTVASSMQESYLIATTGKTPVNGMNWSNYLGTYEGQEYYTNETLGVISAPGVAIDIGQNSTTAANAADLAQIQAILNSGGKLTIVLKPGNTSSELNWGQNTNLWPGSTLGPSAVLTLVGFPVTTVLVSSANPSIVGSNLTFSVTVQTNGTAVGNATGTVVFKDGDTTLGSAGVTNGVAAFSTSALAEGSHTIWAEDPMGRQQFREHQLAGPIGESGGPDAHDHGFGIVGQPRCARQPSRLHGHREHQRGDGGQCHRHGDLQGRLDRVEHERRGQRRGHLHQPDARSGRARDLGGIQWRQ